MRPRKAKGAQPPSHSPPDPKLPDEVKKEEDPPNLSPLHQHDPKGTNIHQPIPTGKKPNPSNPHQTKPGASPNPTEPPAKEAGEKSKPKEKEPNESEEMEVKLEHVEGQQEEGEGEQDSLPEVKLE